MESGITITIIKEIVGGVLSLLPIVITMMAIEFLFPKGPKPTLIERLRGLTIYVVVWAPALAIFGIIIKALHLKPLIPAQALSPYPIVAACIIVLIHDFGFYVQHRLQHRFFWRWHAVHHSIGNISAANAYNHPSEILFDWIAIFLPLTLFGLREGGILAVLTQLQGVYIHSATRLNVGPLRWFIIDNRYHRVHHSRDLQHHDRNFALFFPLWDYVFGTACIPEPKAWPQTGIQGEPEPRSVREYLLRPMAARRA